MPVDYKHPLYAGHEKKAQRVRDAVAGSDAVKGRGELYLPCPGGPIATLSGDERQDAEKRYVPYLTRAVWLGVTSRTHDGMLGAVFRKAPQVELPNAIDYMLEDADGSGMSLTQFSRLCVSKTVQNGRHGVLVDYPEAEDGLTREQTQGLRATLRSYSSESIINWRRDGENLSLVVLHETYEKETDEFERTVEDQYRVLSLEDGRYVQRVFREGVEVPDSRIEPRMANGKPWPVIPFQFVGSVNNDETPDKPLLLDLADVNIAHYRNSADLEELIFLVGQAMVHIDIGDMSTDEWQSLNPNGITVGSRRGVQTKGGSMTMVQADERNIIGSQMERKEAQMLAIGARLIEQRGQNETAEAVRARSGAENANLSTVASNVSDAIENCLEWALMFMSGQSTDSIEFVLNQEFYQETTDPQMVMARISELDRGLIAKQDYRNWRRKNGGIEPERTDEEIDDDVEAGGTNIGTV
jgi:hypothetical protein